MAFPKWDRTEWGPYFREIADRLRLRDWIIYMVDEGPDHNGAHASNLCTKGRKHVTIRLSEDFLRDPEEKQRHTTVHELIHCHMAFLDHTMGECTNQSGFDMCRLALEYAIDGLTDAIAPLMPLPSEVLTKPKAPKQARKSRKRR